MRIGLFGCVKAKGPVPAPAAELYTSPLLVGRRRFVERSCDRWFVLSALHGLVDPDEMVAPYDCSLVGPTSAGERRAWAARVLAAVDDMLGDVRDVVFEVHAGAAYRDHGLGSAATFSRMAGRPWRVVVIFLPLVLVFSVFAVLNGATNLVLLLPMLLVLGAGVVFVTIAMRDGRRPKDPSVRHGPADHLRRQMYMAVRRRRSRPRRDRDERSD